VTLAVAIAAVYVAIAAIVIAAIADSSFELY
jgi:hypothetical protein